MSKFCLRDQVISTSELLVIISHSFESGIADATSSFKRIKNNIIDNKRNTALSHRCRLDH